MYGFQVRDGGRQGPVREEDETTCSIAYISGLVLGDWHQDRYAK